MKRFIIVAVLIILSSLALGLSTEMDGSTTRVLDIPVVSVGGGDWAWLKIGGGPGVLFVGAAGYGIVVFAFIGAGLLLGTGQATAGMIAFGQAGLGIVAFLGQAGTGLISAGQVVIGGLGWAQGRGALDGEEFIKQLSTDLDDLFSFR